MATGSRRLLIKCKGEQPMDMLPRVDMSHTEYIHKLPARARLKLLILEADEDTMDKIVEAIAFVCGSDTDIRQ